MSHASFAQPIHTNSGSSEPNRMKPMMPTQSRTRITLFIAAVLAVVCFGAQHGTTSHAQAPALTQQLATDPQITIGRFPNGLRYYIRANKKPEKRAELRLVVKAGS